MQVKPLAFNELPKVVHGAPATGFATATRSIHTMLVTAMTAQASDFVNLTFYTVSAGRTRMRLTSKKATVS